MKFERRNGPTGTVLFLFLLCLFKILSSLNDFSFYEPYSYKPYSFNNYALCRLCAGLPSVTNMSLSINESNINLLQVVVGRSKSLKVPSSRIAANLILLAMAGDVELNPGPRKPKYPCSVCSKAVKQSDPAFCCDQCNLWIHNKCSGLSSFTKY